MESVPSSGGGSSAGPAPFLLKTYEMVDDSSTDEIVSWSSSNNSFVVWNPQEFARLLLPSYFKHNNFSSFIRQLNTYGFRKSDPEKWEFANEEFIKNQKHLLKNIHRRKPVHSHSHPQIPFPDPERIAFDEEIERLSREKISLETDLLNYKRQHSAAKLRLDTINQQIHGVEHRQDNLILFLEKSVESQCFITLLSQKLESLDFSAFNKKRRLPQISPIPPVPQTDHNASPDDEHSTSRPTFHQDFSNKLTLDLTSPICDSKDAHKDASLELSDTGTNLKSINEESDDHISCHLNLTLASSQLQLPSSGLPQSADSGKKVSSSDDSADKKGASRVNDVFWEQFLSEGPGSSDIDQASSKFSVNSYDKNPGFGISGNTKNMEQLTL